MKRIFAMTLALSGLLLVVVAGSTPASAQGADDPAQVAEGQVVFALSCAGCHGDDGAGVTGAGRPLTGIANQGDRAVHIDSITALIARVLTDIIVVIVLADHTTIIYQRARRIMT